MTVIIRYFQLLRFMRDRLNWIFNNPTTSFNFTGYTYVPVDFMALNATLAPNVKINNILNIQRMGENYELSK